MRSVQDRKTSRRIFARLQIRSNSSNLSIMIFRSPCTSPQVIENIFEKHVCKIQKVWDRASLFVRCNTCRFPKSCQMFTCKNSASTQPRTRLLKFLNIEEPEGGRSQTAVSGGIWKNNPNTIIPTHSVGLGFLFSWGLHSASAAAATCGGSVRGTRVYLEW